MKLLGQDLDLKYLCELRPGLIGWVVLNLSMATKQYVLTYYVLLCLYAYMICCWLSYDMAISLCQSVMVVVSPIRTNAYLLLSYPQFTIYNIQCHLA